MGLYLAKQQDFKTVVRQDAKILFDAGFTHAEIAKSLDTVLKGGNCPKQGASNSNIILSVLGLTSAGSEIVTFEGKTFSSSTDYYVYGIPNGNKMVPNTGEAQEVMKILEMLGSGEQATISQGLDRQMKFMLDSKGVQPDDVHYCGISIYQMQLAVYSPFPPTLVSAMLPDLIREVHFFEGDVPYGIKPEWAVEIHRLVEKEGVEIRLI